MKHPYTSALATLLVLSALAAPAQAAGLRVPQVPVGGGTLQGYLNSVGESINVLTAQQDVQRWTTTISGNTTMTLQIELSGNAANNNLGVYNAAVSGVPPLFQIIPGSASAGWFAVASFRSATSTLVVNLFDATGAIQPSGFHSYSGVTTNNFGFYLQGPGGTFYTQDARNVGTNAPQILVYGGTGQNVGSWWLCFEDTPFSTGVSDFDDAVLFVESVNPTPVHASTWGSLKARFR